MQYNSSIIISINCIISLYLLYILYQSLFSYKVYIVLCNKLYGIVIIEYTYVYKVIYR